ncbi:MAG: hypothetical protein ACSI46_26160 [Gloeotrichia echinulata DVL01]
MISQKISVSVVSVGRAIPTISQYSSVKENCRRGTARIKLSLEEKILDVPYTVYLSIQIIQFKQFHRQHQALRTNL